MPQKRVRNFPCLDKLIALVPKLVLEEVTSLDCEWDACENNSVATFFLSSLYGQQT